MSSSDHIGTGWSFPPQFLQEGSEPVLVSDEEEIRQALEILFSTPLKERYFYPDFGCDLRQFMFEEVDSSLVSRIEKMITQAISSYESRIGVENIDVSADEDSDNILLINIDYTILSTNSKQNMIYPFYVF